MENFKKLNNLFGWLVFLVSAIVYILTAEPTVSLWDCGEFLATSFKLQVGHPPGAPFFMLLARFFSIFAGTNYELVARLVNYSSALASAFTILFLFWSITHIARKIVLHNKKELNQTDTILILGSGLVGALAYTFSDTFWFSAVEAEVYALSSLFTALVFWAVLRWEDAENETSANRWLILIAYLMGLSIGVHLLNLLAIPAIVMIYYFKKYPFSWKGASWAFLISIAILGFVMYGFIQGFVKLGSYFELLFVNSFGFPYNTGFAIYFVLIVGLLVWLLRYAYRKQQYWLQMFALSLSMLLIGYTSYATILIRASANPSLNENDPSNVFALLSYLDREQYGDRPLLYGPYYNAPIVDAKAGKPRYAAINGRYEIIGYDYDLTYDKRFMTLFPRMYSTNPNHIKVYKSWANIKGKPVEVNENGQIRTEYVPTFGENLRFFFTYQVGHMYMRYFLWNFVGRQNDNDDGGILAGNWISGIPFIDKKLVGDETLLPDSLRHHPARNTYYFLPFILGLLGLLYVVDRSRKYAWVTMLLFFFTGLAIVVYLNQTPLQPRERDYAYAGSFYAFAIWIGLGVLAIGEKILRGKYQPAKASAIVAVCLLLVPGLMAKENWNDHNRSHRYLARSLAYNYLQSCAPNAILFTYGDNDTFPLWYLQEVEGIRTDVRVVNTMLLNSDWYIDQMKRKVYQSDPLPISLTREQCLEGKRARIYLLDQIKDPIDIKQAIAFVASDDPRTKTIPGYDESIDFIPGKNLLLPIDTANVLRYQVIPRSLAKLMDTAIIVRLKSNSITKSQLVMLDIIANNAWKRPIYFASPYPEGTCWLDEYLQLDGYAYRLVPIRTPYDSPLECGRINTDTLYHNLMEKFDYRQMNEPRVYIDNFHARTLSVVRFRNNFVRLAQALWAEHKMDSALKVLDRCITLLPFSKVEHDYNSILIARVYLECAAKDKAVQILQDFGNQVKQYLTYFSSLDNNQRSMSGYDINSNLYYLQQIASLCNEFKLGDVAGIQSLLLQYQLLEDNRNP
ncbi:MAG TPA: DUF2723 domain-containing protein [Bacteroidales bacterium]|nr:DUF2723 domain-containing protein [Bacteroidales bacterium]